MRFVSVFMSLMLWCTSFAGIKVSDVKVFSGYPWKEVVVGYTITGTTAEPIEIELRATDKIANKTYTAICLSDAAVTEGRHILRWNAASEGVMFSSGNVVFSVTVVGAYVQLWANGPYWSKFNVGAARPEECGYYFWWGDTEGYKRNANGNGWVSVVNGVPFSFSTENCPTQDKDNATLKKQGYIDASGNLCAGYDAATSYYGTSWRMPTDAEWGDLIRNCDTVWTTRNGVHGHLVTGRGLYASKSIFLPATGFGSHSDFYSLGRYGYYWSSTPQSDKTAWCLESGWNDFFEREDFERYEIAYRCRGHAVRPVRGVAQ